MAGPVPIARVVAITGASGFLGRYAVPWLAARGHRVCAVTRSVGSREEAGFERRMVSSSADAAEWARALAGCETILHLAGRAHVIDETAADPLAAYRGANVEFTRRVLEGAAAAGCRTFVFASSVKAMGERTTVPWTEDTPPAPTEPYGVSKLEAEGVVAEGGRRFGFRTVSIRFPAMYGPGMRANMLRLFEAVAHGVPLPFGAIDNRRSLLFAGNAAAALEVAMLRAGDGGPHYLVSDGEDVSTPDLIRAIARAVGRRPKLIPVPPRLFRLAGRIGDGLAAWLPWPITSTRIQRVTDSLQVNGSRIARDLGFTPPYTMEAGMRETAVWFDSHIRNRQ